ncbi:hypothetical protein [Actinotignum sp. GS-2025b]|uniref:hypothetical protein n=1 Tax=Actinotignum sp. GS-2025b TaxID=3427275 RepID=UPI003F47F409
MDNINALTDIPLLVTTRGRLSVRDALLNAHIRKDPPNEKRTTNRWLNRQSNQQVNQ